MSNHTINRGRGFASKHDWVALQHEFNKTDITLKAFCKRKKVSYASATIKQRLSVKRRQEYHAMIERKAIAALSKKDISKRVKELEKLNAQTDVHLDLATHVARQVKAKINTSPELVGTHIDEDPGDISTMVRNLGTTHASGVQTKVKLMEIDPEHAEEGSVTDVFEKMERSAQIDEKENRPSE